MTGSGRVLGATSATVDPVHDRGAAPRGATGLPRAAAPFVAFPTLLRGHGFAVAPEQTASFLAAIGLLGPRRMDDIRRAAHATLAPPPERAGEFDALFRAFFMGEVGAVALPGDDPADDDVRVHDDDGLVLEPPIVERVNEAGMAAAAGEALSLRRFAPRDESEVLRRFARAAPARLPRRRGYRRNRANRGDLIDFRRTLRQAVRHDGDVPRLLYLRRRLRQRKVLLLIDVSGSMRSETEATLRFAHALARAALRIELFTFGTRLTRITRAIRIRHRDQALARVSGLVPDWDGGTRIGDALQAFLAVPRFAGYARGAITLILSDGLERGEPDAMIEAVTRLSRLSWRLVWLTPLASGPAFTPETAALRSVLPLIDEIGDASSTEMLCAHVLGIGQRRSA